jgi:phage gp37-like protein
MSAIVEYRTRVTEAIRDLFKDELYNVDWYDGLFDEKDLHDWGQGAPAVYVANLNVPTRQHATGQMLGDVQMVAVVITDDRTSPEPRASDAQCWDLMERVADLVNENSFGHLKASIPEGLSIKKLRHPDLRNQGVSLGVVEWTVNITLGRNRARDRDEPRYDADRLLAGERIPMPPPKLSSRLRDENEAVVATETVSLTLDTPP